MAAQPNAIQEDRLWTQLLGFIEDRSVVPIVGPEVLEIPAEAGGTKNFYSLVAEALAEALGLPPPRAAGPRALNEVACSFLAQGGGQAEDLAPEVKRIVQRLERTVPLPEALVKLAGLPFRLYVTTTFDSLVVRAIEARNPALVGRVRQIDYSPARIADLEGFRLDEGPPVVFHLFGKASNSPEYAITEEDLLEFMHALQSEERRPPELFRLLQSRNLLILGCGFPDWVARFFIRLGKQERLLAAYGKTHMLVDSAASNPEFVAFLDHFARRTKRFSLSPVAFVDRLVEMLPTELAPPLAAAAPTATRDPARDVLPGAVFLSYASEDRAIVERMAHALDRAGVDCWFDRQQLEGGDDWEAKIIRNVDGCVLFLAIVSSSTVTPADRFFRMEWRQALKRQDRFPDGVQFLIPVSIDDTQPASPGMLFDFSRVQWERLPRGEPTPEFTTKITRWFRKAQQRIRQPG